MLHLLAQLKKKLQLDHKTNITQNHQKIELYGSLTIKDLKKPYSSRRVGEVEKRRWVESCGDTVWQGAEAEWVVPHSWVVDKHQEGHLGSEGSQPQGRPYSSGFQCQEDKSP